MPVSAIHFILIYIEAYFWNLFSVSLIFSYSKQYNLIRNCTPKAFSHTYNPFWAAAKGILSQGDPKGWQWTILTQPAEHQSQQLC